MKIHFSNAGTSRKLRVFFPGGYNRSFVCTVKPEMLRQEFSNWLSRLTRIYSILWPPFASQNFWVLRTLNFNWFLLQGIYRHFTFKDRQICICHVTQFFPSGVKFIAVSQDRISNNYMSYNNRPSATILQKVKVIPNLNLVLTLSLKLIVTPNSKQE